MLLDKHQVYRFLSYLAKEMKMLEHKGKGYEPIYTRTDLTDDLHQFSGINIDNEIATYKKIKNFLRHGKYIDSTQKSWNYKNSKMS